MELEKLFRENLTRYKAFELGEQPEGEDWVKLNITENALPPIEEILLDINSALKNKNILRKYPDSSALELRKAILNQLLRDKGTLTNRNTVFIGNGSTDVLDVIFKVFVNPGDEVIIFYPTYNLYTVLANLYNAKIKEIKLNEDFSIPESVYDQKGKLLFINSPNDPNGKSIDSEMILKICYNFPGNCCSRRSLRRFFRFYLSTPIERCKKLNNLSKFLKNIFSCLVADRLRFS